MADIEKKTKRYPTDLADAEWDRITPFLAEGLRRKAEGPTWTCVKSRTLSALADRLLLVSPLHASLLVRDDPRRGADDRSRARWAGARSPADRGCELDAHCFGARGRLLRIEMSAGVILFITYCTFCIFAAQGAKPYASIVTTTEPEVTEITET
jgi:hypothetical protein